MTRTHPRSILLAGTLSIALFTRCDGACSPGTVGEVVQLFVAQEALGEGRFKNGFQSRGVTTVLPSITLAAWTSMFTGAPPSSAGPPDPPRAFCSMGVSMKLGQKMKTFAAAPACQHPVDR